MTAHKKTIAFFFLILSSFSSGHASVEEDGGPGENRHYCYAPSIDVGDNTPALSPDIWRKLLVSLTTKEFMSAATISKQFYGYVHDKNVVLAHFGQITRNKHLLGVRFNELAERFNNLWPRYLFEVPGEHSELKQTQAFEASFLEEIKTLWREINIHHMWLNVTPNSFYGQEQHLTRYHAFVNEPENPNNLEKVPEYRNKFSSFESLNLILKAYLIKNTLSDQQNYAARFLNYVDVFLPKLCCLKLWMCSNDRWLPIEEDDFITKFPPRGLPDYSRINKNGFLEYTHLLDRENTNEDVYSLESTHCGLWFHSPNCSLYNMHRRLLKAEAGVKGSGVMGPYVLGEDEFTFTRAGSFRPATLQGLAPDDPGYYLQGWPTPPDINP